MGLAKETRVLLPVFPVREREDFILPQSGLVQQELMAQVPAAAVAVRLAVLTQPRRYTGGNSVNQRNVARAAVWRFSCFG